MFYLAIAAGAVTHVDLLLENPVKLPFLNVELPLMAFFFLAPILFLIVHSFTLSKLVILSDKARRFHEELSAQGVDEADREGLRRQLPSNIFVQVLAGPDTMQTSWFGWLFRTMGWISMAFAPVLLLLLLQLQFLPYHESWLTWELRLALLVDLALLWWLWRKVLAGDGGRKRSKWVPVGLHVAGIGATLAVLIFAFVVATFPGEWRQEAPWPRATDAVFKTLRWPNNTLYLPELNIWEAFKLDDPKKLDWKDHTVSLKERHFEGANFNSAKLGKADLRKAQLQGASLDGAQLQGASLDEAQLQGASLDGAQLQGASLEKAQLQGARLSGAQLQGASFDKAKLQGASLEQAALQGASLKQAQLQGASLLRAQLQGTSLYLAELQGASLQQAQLQGALLLGGKLQATDLRGSFLWRSVWSYPEPMATELATAEWDWRPETEPTLRSEHKRAPWTQERYDALRKGLSDVIPEGKARIDALKRIEILQCAKGVCDTPADVKALQEQIEKAGVDEASYREALAASLQELLCDWDANAIYTLRGVLPHRYIV